MTRSEPQSLRRIRMLERRLRLVRHGRAVLSTVIVLAWLAGLVLGVPFLAAAAEGDPAGFGVLVLYLAVAALALAWCESDA